MIALSEIPTPALVVDRRILERNIAAMAERAAAAGLDLVPHIKTHKCAEILRMQLAAGAAGASTATPAEAELAVEVGAPLVLVAHPPASRDRLARVVALAPRTRLRVALDSEEAAEALDAAAARAGTELEWLWEVDCGVGRCGTPPGAETAARVARLAERTASARFAGLLTFGGHAYAARDGTGLRAAADDEIRAVAHTADELERRGVPAPVRSIGSTPTAHVHDSTPGVTELRPGNYVFHDATQVALETARPASASSPATRGCASSASTRSTRSSPRPVRSTCRSARACASSPTTPARRPTSTPGCSRRPTASAPRPGAWPPATGRPTTEWSTCAK